MVGQHADPDIGGDQPHNLLDVAGDAPNLLAEGAYGADCGHGIHVLTAEHIRYEGDVRIAAQIVEIDTFDAEKPVAAAAVERVAFAYVEALVQTLRYDAVAETHRRNVALDGAQHVDGRCHRHGNRDLRMHAEEAAELPVPGGIVGVAHRMDVEMAGDLLARRFQNVRQANDGREDVAALEVQFLTCFRQIETPRTAVDQFLPDGLLEPFEGHADGGLLQEQPICGRRDAAFLDDHDEGAQQVPIEIVGETFKAVVGHGGRRSENVLYAYSEEWSLAQGQSPMRRSDESCSRRMSQCLNFV